MRETLFRGGSACIPAVPREGLSESLVDPAVAWLQARGCAVVTGRRVAALRIEAGRVSELATTDGPMPVEAVVLAVPPWVAADLLPGQRCPTAFQAILNIHFRVEADPRPDRVHRPGGRDRGMGVRQARARLGHDQRGQSDGGPGRRDDRARGLAGRAGGAGPARARCRLGGW